MQTIRSLRSALVAFLVVLSLLITAVRSPAPDWNYQFGMGNPSDNWLFTGAGVPLTVIGSVQSNTVYYITSADASGAPRIDAVWARTDSTAMSASPLQWWVATNTWVCASNQPVGTNQIWLSTTNAGMATNDLLVLENEGSDSYQLLVLGGGGSSASGLVGTNALQENLIKLWNTPTNGITAGDKIYKLALVSAFPVFPPFTAGVTNQNMTVPPLRGPLGLPCAVTLIFSNSGAIVVSGEYYARPRR